MGRFLPVAVTIRERWLSLLHRGDCGHPIQRQLSWRRAANRCASRLRFRWNQPAWCWRL